MTLTVAVACDGGITHAQQTAGVPQHLESERLVIVTARGRFEISVEIADEPGEQAKGLMFRESLEPDHGPAG